MTHHKVSRYVVYIDGAIDYTRSSISLDAAEQEVDVLLTQRTPGNIEIVLEAADGTNRTVRRWVNGGRTT